MSTETRMPLWRFIEKYNLQAIFEVANSNPHMAEPPKMNHYKVTIYAGGIYSGHEMKTIFSMGLGIKEKPKLVDVLDCIAQDCAGYENARSFEDWAENYGYDTDSRKAERIYFTVGEQNKDLERFLEFAGKDAYKELLWETENL